MGKRFIMTLQWPRLMLHILFAGSRIWVEQWELRLLHPVGGVWFRNKWRTFVVSCEVLYQPQAPILPETFKCLSILVWWLLYNPKYKPLKQSTTAGGFKQDNFSKYSAHTVLDLLVAMWVSVKRKSCTESRLLWRANPWIPHLCRPWKTDEHNSPIT